jgi:hypothetical protein
VLEVQGGEAGFGQGDAEIGEAIARAAEAVGEDDQRRAGTVGMGQAQADGQGAAAGWVGPGFQPVGGVGGAGGEGGGEAEQDGAAGAQIGSPG